MRACLADRYQPCQRDKFCKTSPGSAEGRGIMGAPQTARCYTAAVFERFPGGSELGPHDGESRYSLGRLHASSRKFFQPLPTAANHR